MRYLLRFSLVLALGLCSPSLLAQDEPPPQQAPPGRAARPPKPPTPSGSIHGTVFCADTHKPARGALVMIQELPSPNKESHNNNPAMARTAMDGSYTIHNVAEGEYGVAAFLPGYLSPIDDLATDDLEGGQGDAVLAKRFAAAGTVTVTARQTASHDISITRGATVSGRVLYSDGSPASQVAISVEDISAKPHHTKPGEPDVDMSAMFKTMFTHQTNGTDDEGHFRISGLAPATYRVAAISASTFGMDNDVGGEEMAFLMGMVTDPASLHVYSGDTLHKNAAKTYELHPGDNVDGIDIIIPLNAFHQVRGVLAAVDGRNVNSAVLTLVDTSDDTLHFASKPATDGVFSFSTVPSGTYKLSASGAHIMARDPNAPAETPDAYAPKHPVSAFADATTTLIVKDTDLLDVSLLLTEVPMPKDSAPAINPAAATPQ